MQLGGHFFSLDKENFCAKREIFVAGILCDECIAAAVTPHFCSIPLLIPTFSHPVDARAGAGDLFIDCWCSKVKFSPAKVIQGKLVLLSCGVFSP